MRPSVTRWPPSGSSTAALVHTAIGNMLRTNGVEVTPETILFGYTLYENSGSVDAKTGPVNFAPEDVAKLKAFSKIDEVTPDDVDFDAGTSVVPTTPRENAATELARDVDRDALVKAVAAAPVVRSVGHLVPENQRLSAEQVTEAVADALAKFVHKPVVRVHESVTNLFPGEEPGSTMGVVFNGEIHLFRDAIPNLDAAHETLWHELLHYGLRRFMTEKQYIAKMLELARADAKVAADARAWARGPEGVALLRSGKSTGYVMARGVDEALAELSARMRSTDSAYRTQTLTAKTIRAVVRWLPSARADKLNPQKAVVEP